jgi:hypothetical protein
MPAQISCKKIKKVADPMDTTQTPLRRLMKMRGLQSKKGEKAFFKSIDKKENSDTDSD